LQQGKLALSTVSLAVNGKYVGNVAGNEGMVLMMTFVLMYCCRYNNLDDKYKAKAEEGLSR